MTYYAPIPDFQLANPLYIGATVTFYEVTGDGVQSQTLAPIFSDPQGQIPALNPQTLDSEGKFAAAVYTAVQCVASIVGPNVESHTTGVIGLSPNTGNVNTVPGGVTATAVPVFADTTGFVLQQSTVLISSSGLVSGVAGIISTATADPNTISAVPPTFSGTWTVQNSITSTSTASHTDGRATLNVSRVAEGSGTFGSSYQDTGAFITSAKTNYLTSGVEGEIDGLYVGAVQGICGDAGAIIGEAAKVYSASPSATGGAVAAQVNAEWINASGEALMTVSVICGFAEGAGGVSNHTGYGIYIENWGAAHAVASSQLTPYAGVYVGAYDLNGNAPSYPPTFTNAFVASGSRNTNLDDVFFTIGMGVNQSGTITIGSGNVDGQNGNPTLSGGTRLSIANVNGALTAYAANGSTETLTLSQTGYANLLGGVVLGSTSLAASTFGGSELVIHVQTNQNIISEASVNSGPALTAVNDAGNSFAPFSLGGSTTYLQNGGTNAITISGSQAIQFNAYTTAGVLVNDGSGNVTSTTAIAGVSELLSSGTGGVGYETGAGGTIGQQTSKSTGVTLNKTTGAVTMNNASLGAGTIVSFTLTNSCIGAADVLVLNHISGGTVGSYTLNAQAAAGSATINVRNNTAGSLSEAIVIEFAVIKGATS